MVDFSMIEFKVVDGWWLNNELSIGYYFRYNGLCIR